MAKENEQQVTVQSPIPAKVKTKKVRNRSGHRIELVINGKVVVFYSGKVTEVPFDAVIPTNLGLYVR